MRAGHPRESFIFRDFFRLILEVQFFVWTAWKVYAQISTRYKQEMDNELNIWIPGAHDTCLEQDTRSHHNVCVEPHS